MSDSKKCAHLTCTCVTDKKYCCQNCEDAASGAPNALGCDCAHAGCGGKM